jgi:hypothetical protein
LDLPPYFFRVRENGATVFRVDAENRERRIEMEQIAVVNLKNGEVKAHGAHELTKADRAAIAAWMDERAAMLSRRDIDDIHRTVDHLNHTAHWAQTRASESELDEVTDRLLLSMHDLRSVLAKKKAERLAKTKR